MKGLGLAVFGSHVHFLEQSLGTKAQSPWLSGLSHVARVGSVRDFAYHVHWNPTAWVSRQCTCFSPQAPSLSKRIIKWSRIQNFLDLKHDESVSSIYCLTLTLRSWEASHTQIYQFLPQNLGIFIEIRKRNIVNILIISFFCQLSLPWGLWNISAYTTLGF